MSRALHSAGHEVQLFCQRGSPLAESSISEPFYVNRDLNLNRVDPGNVSRGVSTLRKTLRDFRPDILNPHCPPGHTFSALTAALERLPLPIVRTVAEPRPPKGNLFNRWLHERRTQAIILTTDSSRERYESVFRVGHHAFTIHPGFRAHDFVRDTQRGLMRRQLGIKDDQLLAGIIARMSPEKGQEVLLRALTHLTPDERRRLRVVIAGQDSRERSRSDLETLARQLGVAEYVTFLGTLDSVQPLIADLDLGIITSTRSEAICRIALEYMSFGVPIIASNVNILPEVVRHGENGWTFRNHDAQELAVCISDAMKSTDERQRRGQRGLEMVQDEFSIAHEREQIVGIFENVHSYGVGRAGKQ